MSTALVPAEQILDRVELHISGPHIVESVVLPDGRTFRVAGTRTHEVSKAMWRMLRWVELQEMARISQKIRRALRPGAGR